jgi:pimeloyl-ACP methyl ester carboxylesterase
MIALLAKLMDWSVLQVSSLRMPPFSREDPGLEAALRLLREPDFIPAESQPAQVEFDGPLHFRFPTPRPGVLAENNTVYGRFYRCAERWQERPAILLLHGANSALSHHLRFPWIAQRCTRAGFNTATLELPYHFQRRPRRPGGGRAPYFLRLAEMRAQAVSEIRALSGWLLQQGCPAVALWGSSYGASLAGLTACRDARLAAVVIAVPGVRMKRISSDRILRRSVRQVWQAQRAAREVLDSTALNLISLRPLIPRQNLLLIEGIHDALADSTEELWQQWGQPEIWRVPHGHFSFSLIGAPCLMTRRVLRWLGPRLAPSVTRQEQHDAAQPDGAANRRQPVCPEKKRASALAGSGR